MLETVTVEVSNSPYVIYLMCGWFCFAASLALTCAHVCLNKNGRLSRPASAQRDTDQSESTQGLRHSQSTGGSALLENMSPMKLCVPGESRKCNFTNT